MGREHGPQQTRHPSQAKQQPTHACTHQSVHEKRGQTGDHWTPKQERGSCPHHTTPSTKQQLRYRYTHAETAHAWGHTRATVLKAAEGQCALPASRLMGGHAGGWTRNVGAPRQCMRAKARHPCIVRYRRYVCRRAGHARRLAPRRRGSQPPQPAHASAREIGSPQWHQQPPTKQQQGRNCTSRHMKQGNTSTLSSQTNDLSHLLPSHSALASRHRVRGAAGGWARQGTSHSPPAAACPVHWQPPTQ